MMAVNCFNCYVHPIIQKRETFYNWTNSKLKRIQIDVLCISSGSSFIMHQSVMAWIPISALPEISSLRGRLSIVLK